MWRTWLVVLLFLASCTDRAVAPYPISEPAQVSDSAVGAGDVFDVRVFGEPDLTGTYQVGADGSIAFPLIGRVTVAGRLPADIEKEIQGRLAEGYLRSPQVSVLVKEYRSKKVSVFGQVRQPGTFPFVDNMSIIEAVSRAGGFTASARKNAVRVTRTVNNKAVKIVVAVEDIGQGKAPNFLLRPGDTIFVPERVF